MIVKDNTTLMFIKDGVITESSTEKSIIEVSLMSLVALDCLAWNDIVIDCDHDFFTDNISITIDREAFKRGYQEHDCYQFYDDFTKHNPCFPWGEFVTKKDRMEGLVDMSNTIMTRLKELL